MQALLENFSHACDASRAQSPRPPATAKILLDEHLAICLDGGPVGRHDVQAEFLQAVGQATRLRILEAWRRGRGASATSRWRSGSNSRMFPNTWPSSDRSLTGPTNMLGKSVITTDSYGIMPKEPCA
jgi:hypothetical protein